MSNKQKHETMRLCKKTFKTSDGLRYIKGEMYDVLPMIAGPDLRNKFKLFRVLHPSGGSFHTTEGYINQFFIK